MVRALQIIAPEVERIAVTGDAASTDSRVPRARLRGLDRPVLLGSMGAGMNRLFGLALAAVNASGGLLLIDEVESGLHYSVQEAMWRLLFDLAHRLDIQVFATTHSWDAVESFAQALAQTPDADGQLIRLRREAAHVKATLFDQRALQIATRDEIEVR